MQTVYVARVSGPLAPFADGFRAELDRLGCTPASREYKVNQMGGLSRWLDAEGLGVGHVSSAAVEAFLRVFAANRRRPLCLNDLEGITCSACECEALRQQRTWRPDGTGVRGGW